MNLETILATVDIKIGDTRTEAEWLVLAVPGTWGDGVDEDGVFNGTRQFHTHNRYTVSLEWGGGEGSWTVCQLETGWKVTD